MQFRTQVPIRTYDHPIDYGSRIVSLGSCFAVNIGERFQYYKFQNEVNPFGILFNPIALEKSIEFATSAKSFSADDIFFHNERWHSFDAHSDISHPDINVVLDRLNAACSLSHSAISSATHIIFTLGTAWIYRNIISGEVVANCHKVAQKEFKKELLSVGQIANSLQHTISLLKRLNPELKIIFTVSPVRHIKDGFVENQRSKSHLVTALHEVLGDSEAVYLPSYEIMMDELRDYRFYADDMLHPSQLAIDYIWNRFAETFISADSNATMKEIESINRGLAHRPFDPDSAAHKDFQQKLAQRIDRLQLQFPHIKF